MLTELEYRRMNCAKHKIPFSEKMNFDLAWLNLVDVVSAFQTCNASYSLYFGTLLGFVREGFFIAHDKDTDIATLDITHKQLSEIEQKMFELGFEKFRKGSDIVSFIRYGEYIDLYLFKSFNGYAHCLDYKIPLAFLSKTKKIYVLNELFSVPSDYKSALVDLYGKNWAIPIANFHAPPSYVSKVDRRSVLEIKIANWVYLMKEDLRIMLKYKAPKIFRIIKFLLMR